MKIAHHAPDLLVLRFTRWKSPLVWAALTLVWLAAAAALVAVAQVPMWVLMAWLLTTALPSALLALSRVEKSMLVLDATAGQATLTHRTIKGLHQNVWPLDEVQSTRVTRDNRAKGTAAEDPKRYITLYVREGMDGGRHKLAQHTIGAREALDASAVVSDWMRDWRKRVDSAQPQA